MPSFDFKPGFAEPIRSGWKVQTIRRSKRCQTGDMMQLFTGLRTRQCQRIANVSCILSDYVHLERGGISFGNKARHPDVDDFARWDGFRDYDDMLSWFRNEYGTADFIGYVHRWNVPVSMELL